MTGEGVALTTWAIVSLVACVGGAGPAAPKLVIEGPARVTVDHLGPVEPPLVRLDDGGGVEGLAWEAEPASVAHVRDGELHALGPGEATVRGRWGDQEVAWTLVVEPHIQLLVVDPPASLRVGEARPLQVRGRVGATETAPGPLQFSSVNLSVLTVDAGGEVRALAPGVGYVEVSGTRSGTALVEIEVVPAEAAANP